MPKTWIRFCWIPFVLLLSSSVFAKWDRYLDPVPLHTPEGGRWVRSLIHMHNIYSHDACDSKPQKGNPPRYNTKCLNQFKNAMCDHHIGAVFITEHRTHMAFQPFEKVLNSYQLDSIIRENGVGIGGRFSCKNGHEVLLFPGAENTLMPIAMKRHPNVLPKHDLESTYNAHSPEAAENFRATGALLGVNHLEDDRNTIPKLKAIRPDFVEAYNVHANIEYIYGKLKFFRITKFIFSMIGFLFNPLNVTDLYYLSFLKDDETAMRRWAALAAEYEVTGVAGSDTHQNLTRLLLKDGDRFDSYRRMNRWFSNYIHVPYSITRETLLKSIRNGRVLSVFEIFGSPRMFDFSAQVHGYHYTMGKKLDYRKGITLRLQIPYLRKAKLKGRILRATSEGWEEVARAKSGILYYEVNQPGAYRAEVRIKPTHFRKYIPTKIFLVNKEYPWIYSNPIYIR